MMDDDSPWMRKTIGCQPTQQVNFGLCHVSQFFCIPGLKLHGHFKGLSVTETEDGLLLEEETSLNLKYKC